jgi:hypothetical protein
VEDQLAASLRITLESGKLPVGKEWDVMLNLIAFTAVRVPSFQNAMNSVTDQIMKSMARQAFSGAQGWQRFQEKVSAAGGSTDKLNADAFAEFLASNDYTVSLTQTGYIQTLVDGVDPILETLAARKWNLWQVADGVSDLICSDSPVAVTLAKRNAGGYGIGFGTANTILTMPLSRRLLLIGMFEGRPNSRVMDRAAVASVNSVTAMNANQLFSPDPDFLWRTRARGIAGAQDMLRLLRENAV